MSHYTLGQRVRAKKASWAGASYHDMLIVRKARYSYRCHGCDGTINKGDMHGSSFYDHYCLLCVTPDEPHK